LNVHGFNVRQTQTHTTKLLILEPSYLEDEIANEKQTRYKEPGTDQIAAELIQAEGNTLYYEIHKLIKPILNKEEFPQQWKESIIVPIYNEGDKTDCSNYREI
jgi:hypothetical protein